MTFSQDRPSSSTRAPAPPKRRSPLAVTAAVIGVLSLVTVIFANIWTEWVWFAQLGFSSIFVTSWLWRIGLFVVFGGIAAAAVWGSLWIARRSRPAASLSRSSLDQLREQIRPLENAAMIVLPLVVGSIAGLAMSSRWEQAVLFVNRVPFGETDPQFNLDASFYVFTLPVLQSLAGFYTAIAIVCALLAGFVHLLYGGISGSGRKFVASRGARTQLAITGVAVMLGVAANYWLDRYALLNKVGEDFYGATYTDVNAVLPAKSILLGASLLVAVLFLAVIWRGDWRIPAVGVALMVLTSIAVGGIYPAVVQRFQVEPNAQELEAQYIQRNIDATLTAYGLDDLITTQYNAASEADAQALRDDASTTAQIRLLDPNIISPAFQQLQQNKQYYNFADTLNVDRYEIDGELSDTVIAVRELYLDGLSDENRSWVNDVTVFTHGFGVVAAYGNRTNRDGQPSFFEGNIPPSGTLGEYEPRIYFGQTLPPYAIVGAPEGTEPWELDYPDDTAPNGQVNTTYTGDGGPSVGSPFEKLMYAIKFGEEQIVFSNRVTSESQVLYYRNPLERVARVAPYLELDATTYPAVVDGRVVWVVDGYTTTDKYPYAAGLVATSDVFATAANQLVPTSMNYVRNSVKATVDAYDGSVTLYAWDAEDPILQAWQSAFPASYKPMSEISGDLMSHLRYPQGLFAIQRLQLTKYHVTDAASFFTSQDFWANPADPTISGTNPPLQPPYYQTLQMPGQDEPAFSLTTSFIPGGNSDRNILTGYLAVNSETGNTPGEVHEDYGTLRLLELPRDTTVSGPGQAQNNFNSDPEAQNVLQLLRQGETDVINGNLLTLPVGGGLLYVQPVYVQSKEGTKVPLLRKVFVAFGEEVGFADTLQQALDQVFGAGVSEPNPGDPDPVDPDPVDPDPVDPGTEEPTPPTTDTSADEQALRSALESAKQAIAAGQEALAIGDFAAYGQAQDDLAAALEDAIAAERRIADAAAASE